MPEYPRSPLRKVGTTIHTRVDLDDLEIHGSTGEDIYVLSTDNTTLSGTPIIARFNYKGKYYYTKFYPTVATSTNASIDDIGVDARGIDDATLSGTPKVFEIISNSTSYYLKAYPAISAEVASSRGITITPVVYDDAALSGTPRIATVEIGSIDYYTKVYPTKA